MVGKEVVEGNSEVSTLQEGAGEIGPLKQKDNFEQSPHHRGSVYFIRSDDAIKIGFTENFKRRFGSLQTANEKPLEILAIISSEFIDEMQTHQRFAHLRIRGEWFRADQELIQFTEYAKLKYGEAVPYEKPAKRKAAPKPPSMASKLHALMSKYGKHTPVGHCCSTILEMLKYLPDYERPAWAGHDSQVLTNRINRQIERLAELTA